MRAGTNETPGRGRPPKKLVVVLLAVEVLCLGVFVDRVLKTSLADPSALGTLACVLLVGSLLFLPRGSRQQEAAAPCERPHSADFIDALPEAAAVVDESNLIMAANARARAMLIAEGDRRMRRPLSELVEIGELKGKVEGRTRHGNRRVRLSVHPFPDSTERLVLIEEIADVIPMVPPAKSEPILDRLWERLCGLAERDPGSMVDALLEVRRLRLALGGGGPLRVRTGDLAQLVHRRALVLEPIVRARSLELDLRVEGATVGSFDADHLGRAVEEILLNAIAYSVPGGTVTIHVSGDAQDLSIVVRDSGLTVGSSKSGGGDLGLTRARRIVEAHGGSFLPEALKGAGTRVSVAIPLAG